MPEIRIIVKIKRFFLSPATFLVLIALALLAMSISIYVPQSFMTSPEALTAWQSDYPGFAPVAEKLGLMRVYTHPAFIAILACFVVSLSLSCWNQIKLARQRTFSDMARQTGDTFGSSCTMEELSAILLARRYLRITASDGVRFVRNPWGYWGNVLVHFGILTVIVASLWVALTQQRGKTFIIEGQTFYRGAEWLATETGLLAGPLILDEDIRIDKVAVDYSQTSAVSRIASSLAFFDKDGKETRGEAEVNSILTHDGLRIYQGMEFGLAFSLEIEAPDGNIGRHRLMVMHPKSPDKASYADFKEILGAGRLLRAKYFAEADRSSLRGENPLLTLRIDDNGRELGQVSLTAGGEGEIAGYRIRLAQVNRWTGLLMVKFFGLSGVVFGFVIICLGPVLHYFTPPREVTARITPEGVSVSFRAIQFSEFYTPEFEEIKQLLSGKGNHGQAG